MKKINEYRFSFFLAGFSITCLFVLNAFKYTKYVKVRSGDIEIEVYESDEPRILSHFPEVKVPKVQQTETRVKKQNPLQFDLIDIIKLPAERKIFQPPVVLTPPKAIVNTVQTPAPDNKIYSYYQVPASFPGGSDALHSYIKTNLVYPEGAELYGKEGYVTARFVVEKDGSVSSVEILKDEVGYGAIEYVTAVLMGMPKWSPAEMNGHKIRTYQVLPIKYEVF